MSGGRTIRGRLDWDDASRARFEISSDEPGGSEHDDAPHADAVVVEVLKLARAVRQTGQERLSRWRG